jgi:hypothetical protein
MSKKILVISAMVVVAIIAAVVSYYVFISRNLSPPGTATYSSNGFNISVDYFRPSKRNRVIFGNEKDGALQPNGKYWRLGANDATEITFNKDVIFGSQPVKAGRYRMYANLTELSWAISLNSELNAYGATPPDHSLDVATIDVPVEKMSSVVEMFTITFDEDAAGARMHLAWDLIEVVVPIAVQ